MISKRSFLSGLAASAVAGLALAQMAPASLADSAKPIDTPNGWRASRSYRG